MQTKGGTATRIWVERHWRQVALWSFVALVVTVALVPGIVPDWLRAYYGLTNP